MKRFQLLLTSEKENWGYVGYKQLPTAVRLRAQVYRLGLVLWC